MSNWVKNCTPNANRNRSGNKIKEVEKSRSQEVEKSGSQEVERSGGVAGALLQPNVFQYGGLIMQGRDICSWAAIDAPTQIFLVQFAEAN